MVRKRENHSTYSEYKEFSIYFRAQANFLSLAYKGHRHFIKFGRSQHWTSQPEVLRQKFLRSFLVICWNPKESLRSFSVFSSVMIIRSSAVSHCASYIHPPVHLLKVHRESNDFCFLYSAFMHVLLTGRYTGNHSGKDILGNGVPSFSFAVLRSP